MPAVSTVRALRERSPERRTDSVGTALRLPSGRAGAGDDTSADRPDGDPPRDRGGGGDGDGGDGSGGARRDDDARGVGPLVWVIVAVTALAVPAGFLAAALAHGPR